MKEIDEFFSSVVKYKNEAGLAIMRIDTSTDISYLILCNDGSLIIASRSDIAIDRKAENALVKMPHDRIAVESMGTGDVVCTSIITDITGKSFATIHSADGKAGVVLMGQCDNENNMDLS